MASKNNDARSSKLKVLSRSPTVQQLREDIRKQFHDKLRLNRSNEISRRRALFKNAVGAAYHTFRELQNTLLTGAEELTAEEMLQIWTDIECELRNDFNQQQADQYALELELNEDSYICSICNGIKTSDNLLPRVICDTCASLYFNSSTM